MSSRQTLIDPNYLIQLSNSVESLNHFYEQQQLGSLSTQYKTLLISTFASLNQNLHLYAANSQESSSMCQSAVLKCKSELEIFCLEKLGYLLTRETEEIGRIVLRAAQCYRENVEDWSKVLLAERRERVQEQEGHKDALIQKLKMELQHRKQHISELRERIQELEQDNSKIYSKLIKNTKNVTDRSLSMSPRKNMSQTQTQVQGSPSLAKFKSQAILNAAHKAPSAKQVQQTIMDIMDMKAKQQSVKGNKSSLKEFLKNYFKYKFGVKEMAEQTLQIFKDAVEFFSQKQQKNIFLLFLKMLSEECQQKFFQQQRIFLDKVTKVVKRYLNQKQNISLDELQRVYDSRVNDQKYDVKLSQKDIQCILVNLYKTSQVDSLQMILNQILTSRVINMQDSSQNTRQLLIPSKKAINQILNYQLNRHLIKIQDIVHAIGDTDINNERGYLNQEQLQSVIAKLRVPVQRIQANMGLIQAYHNRFITRSEAIEIIQRVRKGKGKKK